MKTNSKTKFIPNLGTLEVTLINTTHTQPVRKNIDGSWEFISDNIYLPVEPEARLEYLEAQFQLANELVDMNN